MSAPRRSRGATGAALGAAAACLLSLAPVACDSSLSGLGDAVGTAPAAEPPEVIFLATAPTATLAPEEAAAWEWLQQQPGLSARHLQLVDLAAAQLAPEAVLWWHYADEATLPSVAVRPETLAAFRDHLSRGGGLLLTLFAAPYVVPLGLEASPPDDVRIAPAMTDGALAGGAQSTLGHPLLERFWGGAFTAGGASSQPRPWVAYSGDRWPTEGRVWAVDKTEQRVDSTLKIGVEYPAAAALGGHVVTLGAHCHFADAANHNRPQLSHLVVDTLLYLGGNLDAAPAEDEAGTAAAGAAAAGATHWMPDDAVGEIIRGVVTPTTVTPAADMGAVLNDMETTRSGLEMVGFPTAETAAPFTIASPRAVVFGSQMGRIEEFRAHPYRILRGLRFAVVRPDRGVTWLDTGGGDRTFIARPEGSELTYTDGEITVSLKLAVDWQLAGFVAVLAVRSPAALELVASWETDFSSDWPQAQPPRRPLAVAWDDGAQAVVWSTRSGIAGAAGFGGAPSLPFLGFDPELHVDETGLLPDEAATTSALGTSRVATQVHIEPEPGRATLVSFVAAGATDLQADTMATYAQLSAAPGRPWTANAQHYRKFLDVDTLSLITPPDSELQFDDLFKWAKVGIEALRVSAPGMGAGIFAGYGAAAPSESRSPSSNAFGGSGALWASMAANAYGDSSLSADTLRLLARFQTVDGRVPSAASAAWQFRYDDATTTPMFLVAVDNHVRTWGERSLLESIWPAVTRAIDHGFAADRNGDGLIDPISVDDRWHADRRIGTTIHLAALWGAALEAAAHLAEVMDDPDLATRCREHAAIVRQTLNERFWDPAGRTFHFATLGEERFAEARSVLAAVPMVFNLLDAGIANAPLDSFAADELTVDWGVALASTEQPPAGTALEGTAEPQPAPAVLPEEAADRVSPLFTGWAALAEFANHRSEAGFLHSAANLRALSYNNPGYASEGMRRSSPVPAVGMPHEAAAQALTVLPIVWGMLGIRPDATSRTLTIAPHLPPGWNRVIVEGVRLASDEFRVQLRRTPTTMEFIIDRRSGNQPVTFRLSAHVPNDVALGFDRAALAGAELVAVDGVDELIEDSSVATIATVELAPTGSNISAVFRHGPYPQLIPESPPVQAPQPSSGLRVIRTRYLGEILQLELQGLPGQTYELRLATPWPVSRVSGIPDVLFTNPEPGRATIEVTVPGPGNRYRSIDLEVAFQR